MVFVSHSHMYAAYNQTANHHGPVEVRLTGGLGAPLVKGLSVADGGFHHFLLIDIPLSNQKTTALKVEVVKFTKGQDQDPRDEADEKED